MSNFQAFAEPPTTQRPQAVLPSDTRVHDWYTFVLSFPPHLVRHYLESFGVTKDDVVLDPFCGTGTTLVECKKLRIPSVGVEATPMAAFASDTKVNWKLSPVALLRHADQIGEKSREVPKLICGTGGALVVLAPPLVRCGRRALRGLFVVR